MDDLFYADESRQALVQELAELRMQNADLRAALAVLANKELYGANYKPLQIDIVGQWVTPWEFARQALDTAVQS